MDKFKNIEKSFESQQKLLEKDADKQTRYNQEETTDDSLGILKLVKHSIFLKIFVYQIPN